VSFGKFFFNGRAESSECFKKLKLISGDGTDDLFFTDTPINYNGTVFNHVYTSEGTFLVNINCANAFSTNTSSVNHTTQNPVTGLSAPLNRASVNSNFKIDFSLTGGSLPNFALTFNNTPLTVTYNSATMTGTSDVYSTSVVQTFYIELIAWNSVSLIRLLQPFEIGIPITGASFIISTPFLSDSFTGEVYDGTWEFGTSMQFVVDIQAGANVKLDFYTGEEDTAAPTYSYSFQGTWNGPLRMNYTYIDPLDYSPYVVLSNLYNSVTLSQNVSIMTDTKNIVPYLQTDPVVYSVLGAQAYYLFSFYGNTKSGSHARYEL
jgi:hypothetical protein